MLCWVRDGRESSMLHAKDSPETREGDGQGQRWIQEPALSKVADRGMPTPNRDLLHPTRTDGSAAGQFRGEETSQPSDLSTCTLPSFQQSQTSFPFHAGPKFLSFFWHVPSSFFPQKRFSRFTNFRWTYTNQTSTLGVNVPHYLLKKMHISSTHK